VVIVVVEDALLLGVTPEPIVAGGGLSGTADGVCTADSGDHSPSSIDVLVNVIDEDLLKAIFAIFAVAPVLRRGHSALVPRAVCHRAATPLEPIAELLEQRVFGIHVRVRGVRAGHRGLRDDYDEISKRDFVLVLVEESRNSEFGQALLESAIVFVVEVDAAVRATFVLTFDAVVHEIMAGRAQEASYHAAPLVRLCSEFAAEPIEVGEDRLGNRIIVSLGHVLGELQAVGEHLLEVLDLVNCLRKGLCAVVTVAKGALGFRGGLNVDGMNHLGHDRRLENDALHMKVF